MAPRIYQDDHGFGDTKCSRRIAKCKSKGVKLAYFDSSKMYNKQCFFRSLGLEMKRIPYLYNIDENSNKPTIVHVPSGVVIKDCQVVITGATCHICKKDFKCVYDVKIHSFWRHGRKDLIDKFALIDGINSDKCKNDRATKSLTKKSIVRVIIKLGGQLMSAFSVKRKYLKDSVIDSSTRTSEDIIGELTNKCENIKENIDRTNDMLNVRSKQKKYKRKHSISQPCKRRKHDQNVVSKESQPVAELISTSRSTEHAQSLRVGNDFPNGSLSQNRLEILLPDTVISENVNVKHNLNEQKCANDVASNIPKNEIVSKSLRDMCISIPRISKNITILPLMNINNSVIINDSCVTASAVPSHREKSFNAVKVNSNLSVRSGCPRAVSLAWAKTLIKQTVINTFEVPSNPNTSAMVESATNFSSNKKTREDDVQEVLRITREKRKFGEMGINHESPSRAERRMLVLDAIREISALEKKKTVNKVLLSKKKKHSGLTNNSEKPLSSNLDKSDINCCSTRETYELSDKLGAQVLEVNNNNAQEFQVPALKNSQRTEEKTVQHVQEVKSSLNNIPIVIDLACESDDAT